MTDQQEYLTKEKYNELQSELETLKKVKRKEVAESLEYAKSLGDLSENAEYHEARDMQAAVEDRISKIESILASATIVAERHGGVVGVGSTVLLKSEKSEHTFTVVGSEESSIASGKISTHAPLGAALLGKRKGETFTFKTPKGDASYTIVSVK